MIKIAEYSYNDNLFAPVNSLGLVCLSFQSIEIFINTNEKCGHYRPHVHAVFGKKHKYQISIDHNFVELNGKNDIYFRKIIKTVFNDENIQFFRKQWNEKTNSIYKFPIINNKYCCN